MSPKRLRPAVIRYYFDADILGLAKLVGQIRADVTFPGDPGGVIRQTYQRAPCIITDTATRDLEWIPQVAARGWSIVLRGGGRWVSDSGGWFVWEVAGGRSGWKLGGCRVVAARCQLRLCFGRGGVAGGVW